MDIDQSNNIQNHTEQVTADTSRESVIYRGVQEVEKRATGELHARPTQPRPPSDQQAEEQEIENDEIISRAQALNYQQEIQNEGDKIAMQRGGEVDRQDLGYTDSAKANV